MRLLISGSWVRAPRWALLNFVFVCFNLCFLAAFVFLFWIWIMFCEFPINNEKKEKKQFKRKNSLLRFKIVGSRWATPSFKKSLPRDSTKRNALYFETPFNFSACFTLDLSFLLLHAAANFQQTWVNCSLLSVSDASRFVPYVSHNNVWRHSRKNFFEEFCLLIVIILFLLHNYFIIPKLAITRSNRAKRVQNCLSLFIRKDWVGALWGWKMKKE